MLSKVLRLIFVSVAAIAVFFAFTCYLVSAGLTLPLTISQGSALLAQIFGVSGLVWIILYCGAADSPAPTVKLIGSILVLSLAFASNSAWTYALSIFIVATLVTELEFLEKLAALFTNRKEYWEWRSKMSTRAEAERKALDDAITEEAEKAAAGPEIDLPAAEYEIDSPPSPDIESTPHSVQDGNDIDFKRDSETSKGVSTLNYEVVDVSKAQERAVKGIKFSKLVISALRSDTSPFGRAEILENMVYQKGNYRLDVDAVIELDNIHYVVEIKFATALGVIGKALWKARHLAAGYLDYIKSRGVEAKVQAVLILPLDAIDQAKKARYTGVMVYFYDPDAGHFLRML